MGNNIVFETKIKKFSFFICLKKLNKIIKETMQSINCDTVSSNFGPLNYSYGRYEGSIVNGTKTKKDLEHFFT